MMNLSPLISAIIIGTTGAIRLIKLDINGLGYFGNSKTDFWHSYLGAVLLAPLFILYFAIRFFNSSTDGSFSVYLIAQMIAYSITWLTFPLIMLYLAPILKRTDKMIHYLIAYNWVSVIQNCFYLPVVILGISGVFPNTFTNFLAVSVLLWVLGMNLFVARKALQVSLLTAAGIVIMDLFMGLFIEVLTRREL